jgi:hypothetical protein|tara:strand:- start:83 stop:445 length:363 start_codon:yes stop_codon:yes gene_type:complete
MSFFSAIGDFTKSAIGSVGSFFKSDTFNTAKTIAKGASSVIDAMQTAAGKVDLSQPPTGLVNPNVGFSGRMTGASRSTAGTASFSDIGEATYYKYAQLQNTIRYLYGTKSRYKSIAKDRS